MGADKTLSWSHTEEFVLEDELTNQARLRGLELGTSPVSPATGATLRMLAASVAARSGAEIGTGTGTTVQNELLELVTHRHGDLRPVDPVRYGARRRPDHDRRRA